MNNQTRNLLLPLSIILFVLCGCSTPHSQFVLLPSPDGHVGKVTVANKAGECSLDKAFESVDLFYPEGKPAPPVVLAETEVNTIFKEALAAQPNVPVTYLLYFEPGSATLTQDSEKLLPQIIEYIRKTGSIDISISGHSDKVGARDVNIRISRERADLVAKRIKSLGIVPGSLEVASYGMELPLIDTPEGTPEPRNRRVELVVR